MEIIMMLIQEMNKRKRRQKKRIWIWLHGKEEMVVALIKRYLLLREDIMSLGKL
jgi:hypothetical protein